MCKAFNSYELGFYNFKAILPDWVPADYELTPAVFSTYEDAEEFVVSKLDEFEHRAIECGEYARTHQTWDPEGGVYMLNVVEKNKSRYTGYITIDPVTTYEYEF